MEAVLIAIGAFIPMLLVLVVVHEFGHFFTARALGVKVLEFGVGFPPRAFGFYTGRTPVRIDQQTVFVNVNGPEDLRSGQFVRVSSAEDSQGNLVARVVEAPEPKPGLLRRVRQGVKEAANPDGAVSPSAADYEEYLKHEGTVKGVGPDSFVLADMLYSVNWTPLGGFVRLAGESNPSVPRSLASKGAGTRATVLVAGPLMNAILPLVIFAILFMIPQDVTVGNVVVTQVAPESPAAAAGVQPGDIIHQAGGHEIENQVDLIRAISLNLGSEMEWVIERGGQREVVQVRPRYNSPEGQGATGVGIDLINQRQESRSDPPWTAIYRSFTSTGELLVLLKNEVSSWIGGRSPQLSGPIGIAQVTGEITQERGLIGWMALGIVFSINLAILNILPIPMLDGGRLVFVVLEWIRRGKRVPPEKEGLVHLIGFVFLIGVIILISANDISRLIQGGSPLGG